MPDTIAHKGKYCRNDHQTCQHSNQSVEELNLIDRLHQVHIVLYIGAVGYHDTHSDADREKQLSYGIHKQ